MSFPYESFVRKDGAVAYWPMGKHKNVDVVGGFHFTTIPAQTRESFDIGDVYSAMGADQTYSGSSPTAATTNISLEFWLRPYTLPAAGSTIVSLGAVGTNGVELEWQANWVFRANLGGVGTLTDATRPLIRGEWNHIVVTRGASTWSYYVNGVLSNTAGTTAPTAATVMQLGASTSAAQDIRDVAVYTVELSGTQVRTHFLNNPMPPVMTAWASEVTGDFILVPTAEIGITLFTPTALGPGDIDVPFMTIDVETFEPTTVTELVVPFTTIGFFAGPVLPGSETPGPATPITPPVDLVEGALPPFVPPSLPPTLGGGGGATGGGGSGIPPVGPGVPLPPLSSGGLAGIRFYQGPPWRWVVTDLDSETVTFLDRLAFEVEVRYILDRASSARLSMPSSDPEVNIDHTDGFPFVNEGDRRLYGFRREGGSPRWVCRFGGTILQTEDTGLTENARTIATAIDPWQLLYQRPMVNIDGDFPDEAGFFSFNDTQVGTIALTFLRNTIINHGDVGIDMGDSTPAWSEDLDGNPVQLPGSPYWGSNYSTVWSGRTKSVYETTTDVDIGFQQGMSVGEVWDQLVQSGALDIVLTPVYDPVNRPGITHEISIYNRVGVEAADAVMAWDKPSRNLVKINHIKDGIKRANTVRYYEGQGGPQVGPTQGFADGPSIIRYGEYWAQQFFPGRVEEAVEAFATLQLLLRANGVDTVSIEPTNERAPFLFTEWWLGDTVPVFASTRLREAITGFQRIYGIVLNIDENSYERIPQVLGSPEA